MLNKRRSLPLIVVALAALGPLAATGHAAYRGTVSVSTVSVGAPGNAAIAVVPFTDAAYGSCSEVPAGTKPPCQAIGSVDYNYEIGQLEVTVGQWVTFLNTVDPKGTNRHRLYEQTQSSKAWPQYGQLRHTKKASDGRHYAVGSPEWANKPYGFANFFSAARFANSLYNGTLIEKQSGTTSTYSVTTYKVKLSPKTQTGMYNLNDDNTQRRRKSGFVVPSQNEWVKAAYYDPSTKSYWKFPTNPGTFANAPGYDASTAVQPLTTQLNYDTGDVTNATGAPIASIVDENGNYPAWCPKAAQTSPSTCTTQNPLGLSPKAYAEVYKAGLSSVGQALVRSPWGTLDQGGNAVEWTDTLTPPPFGITGIRTWRRLHGGVSNSTDYQLWPSAIGLQPQDNQFYDHVYPWLGIRIGVIGSLKVKPASRHFAG